MYLNYPEYVCSIKGYKKRKLTDLEIEEKLDIVDIVHKDDAESLPDSESSYSSDESGTDSDDSSGSGKSKSKESESDSGKPKNNRRN